MTQQEVQQRADDDSAREFAIDLMSRIKIWNRGQGIGLSQAMWTHAKLRALECNVTPEVATMFPPLAPIEGVPLQIDLLNLVISGDLECAYGALLCCTPDDGSQPYHWLTSEKINWIRHQIGMFLGWE